MVASAPVGLAYAPILASFLEFAVTHDRCWRFAALPAVEAEPIGPVHLLHLLHLLHLRVRTEETVLCAHERRAQ